MPAPKLIHSIAAPSGTTPTVVGAAVPSGRALVGKVVVSAGATTTVTLFAGTTPGEVVNRLAGPLAMAAGDVYTEANLVLREGESVSVTTSAVAAIVVHLFGEEVDG